MTGSLVDSSAAGEYIILPDGSLVNILIRIPVLCFEGPSQTHSISVGDI